MIEQVFDWTWGWIIVGAAIAGLEILVPGMYLLWIGLGAVAVGVVLARYPELSLAWQMLVFAVSMVSSIGIGFWIQRRSGRTKHARFLNRELKAMIGQSYIAIAPFTVGHGRIKVQDSSYAAISDEAIEAGDVVKVIAIEDGRPKVVKAPAPSERTGRRDQI
jgi:membrane protein implicated in regulation of membrane protease activity